MNAVLQKSNYNTIELRRPSVCSVCCNIFEDYDTPYMNTEGISQIQANKKAYLKKLSSSVLWARYVVQTAASQLPCLVSIISQILFVLVFSGYFLAVGDFLSKRSWQSEILYFFIYFLSPCMKSRRQKIMEKQVEMSHVTVLRQ